MLLVITSRTFEIPQQILIRTNGDTGFSSCLKYGNAQLPDISIVGGS